MRSVAHGTAGWSPSSEDYARADHRSRVVVVDDYEAFRDCTAEVVIEQMRKKPDRLIGFATGGTPKGLCARVIEAHLPIAFNEHGSSLGSRSYARGERACGETVLFDPGRK